MPPCIETRKSGYITRNKKDGARRYRLSKTTKQNIDNLNRSRLHPGDRNGKNYFYYTKQMPDFFINFQGRKIADK